MVKETLNSHSGVSRYADTSQQSNDTPKHETQRIEQSVRELMAQECRSAKRDCLPELSPADAISESLPLRREVKHPRASDRWYRLAQHGKLNRRVRSGTHKRFGLSRAHGGIILLAMLMFLFPLLIPTILLLTFWLVLISYLSLGPDRVAEVAKDKWFKLAYRRPDMAAQLRQNAEEAAFRIDRCLDRLPDNWRDSINLPEFADSLRAEVEAKADPFGRLRTQERQ